MGDAVKRARIPLDYAIDALAIETDRRSKAHGRPYSYGQLIADTTPEQREQMAESYRESLERVSKKGSYRVLAGAQVKLLFSRGGISPG